MTVRTTLKTALFGTFAAGMVLMSFPLSANAQATGVRQGDVLFINTVSASTLGERKSEAPSASSTERSGGATGITISVSRGTDLVGNPSHAVRENYGDDSIASSYSDRPVIMVGLAAANAELTRSPLDGLRVTSRFGSRRHPIDGVSRLHAGIDYGAAHGTPIMATGDARVSHAGRAGGYGLLVKLDHGSGLETRYAHMSRIAVSVGDSVSAGQVIGYVGSTGRSTGAHLHYEIRQNGRAVDPLTR